MFFFKRKKKPSPVTQTVDAINRDYVCLHLDPENTINNLNIGDWNMHEVQKSLSLGLLRYAKQSEVDHARAENKIVNERQG